MKDSREIIILSEVKCKTDTTSNALFLFFLPLCEQQQEQDPTNLYISNLPLCVDEKELENMLQPFGQVVSTRILRDYSGNSRGVGFARSVAAVIVSLFKIAVG